MRPDDTPRFVKGRDKAEWQGRGERYDDTGSQGARRAAQAGSRRGPLTSKSAWGHTSNARSIADLVGAPDIVGEIDQTRRERMFAAFFAPALPPSVHVERVEAGIEQVRWGDRTITAQRTSDMDMRPAPPKNRTPTVPDGVVPSRWHIHHGSTSDRPSPHLSMSERHRKGIKRQGKAAQLLAARRRQ